MSHFSLRGVGVYFDGQRDTNFRRSTSLSLRFLVRLTSNNSSTPPQSTSYLMMTIRSRFGIRPFKGLGDEFEGGPAYHVVEKRRGELVGAGSFVCMYR